MNVYLSACFCRKDELLRYRAGLERDGHVVTSTWLDAVGPDPELEALGKEAARVIACADWEQIRQADVFVAFAEPALTSCGRGGRFVELGLALALQDALSPGGLHVILVGQPENVFEKLRGVVQADDWDAALAHLAKIQTMNDRKAWVGLS